VSAQGVRGADSRMMLDLRRNTDFDCCDSVITDDGPGHTGGGVNRSELIDAVAREMALTKREAESVVGAVIGNIVDEVRSGRRVSLVGFGSFNPTRRAARTGRNPQTGAPVDIPASKGVRFVASSTLKSIVNGKAEPAARKAVTVPAKSTAKKSTARKTTARKTTARKSTAKKTGARKTAARKTTAKRAPARKSTARKTTARKTTARKTTAKKVGARKKATAKKTTARKTAVRKTAAKKTTARKTTAKKAGARKTTARKTTARKTTAKRAPARKTATKRAPARKAAGRKRAAAKR
jgi:DNA-binding protein HU-beta